MSAYLLHMARPGPQKGIVLIVLCLLIQRGGTSFHPGGVNPQQGMGIIPTLFGIHQGKHFWLCCSTTLKGLSLVYVVLVG